MRRKVFEGVLESQLYKISRAIDDSFSIAMQEQYRTRRQARVVSLVRYFELMVSHIILRGFWPLLFTYLQTSHSVVVPDWHVATLSPQLRTRFQYVHRPVCHTRECMCCACSLSPLSCTSPLPRTEICQGWHGLQDCMRRALSLLREEVSRLRNARAESDNDDSLPKNIVFSISTTKSDLLVQGLRGMCSFDVFVEMPDSRTISLSVPGQTAAFQFSREYRSSKITDAYFDFDLSSIATGLLQAVALIGEQTDDTEIP